MEQSRTKEEVALSGQAVGNPSVKESSGNQPVTSSTKEERSRKRCLSSPTSFQDRYKEFRGENNTNKTTGAEGMDEYPWPRLKTADEKRKKQLWQPMDEDSGVELTRPASYKEADSIVVDKPGNKKESTRGSKVKDLATGEQAMIEGDAQQQLQNTSQAQSGMHLSFRAGASDDHISDRFRRLFSSRGNSLKVDPRYQRDNGDEDLEFGDDDLEPLIYKRADGRVMTRPLKMKFAPSPELGTPTEEAKFWAEYLESPEETP